MFFFATIKTSRGPIDCNSFVAVSIINIPSIKPNKIPNPRNGIKQNSKSPKKISTGWNDENKRIPSNKKCIKENNKQEK